MLDIEGIRQRWYASIYDQQENHTDDVEFLLNAIGNEPKRILEVCCGTGRILVPLAQAGHDVVGFDVNEAMLGRIAAKAAGMKNIAFYRADALLNDWGAGFDIVILAGNILINIKTKGDYREAQRLFIQKAAMALKPGGCVYLDFYLNAHPARGFAAPKERVIFEGRDEAGTYGRFLIVGGVGGYDTATQTATGGRRTEITLPDGQTHVFESAMLKHIPTLAQVHAWLAESGLEVDWEFGSYDGKEIGEHTHRAVIRADRVY